MRNISRFLVYLATVIGLVSCASGPKIQTDYDRSIDFSEFHTFGFYNPMSIENPSYSSILGQTFRDVISVQMRQRGYAESDEPDILINVSARLQNKTRVTTTSNAMHGGYYGYRRGMYDPWRGYRHGTTTHVSQYTEGTVNIDMVDFKQKRMVWEGVAIGRVTENRTNEEQRDEIRSGVAEMFEGYPFRAGQ